MEVGLSPGNFVLDGDPARPLNGPPIFIIGLVIVISLEHCTVVIGLFTFKFKFYSTLCILFLGKKQFNRTQSVPI